MLASDRKMAKSVLPQRSGTESQSKHWKRLKKQKRLILFFKLKIDRAIYSCTHSYLQLGIDLKDVKLGCTNAHLYAHMLILHDIQVEPKTYLI